MFVQEYPPPLLVQVAFSPKAMQDELDVQDTACIPLVPLVPAIFVGVPHELPVITTAVPSAPVACEKTVEPTPTQNDVDVQETDWSDPTSEKRVGVLQAVPLNVTSVAPATATQNDVDGQETDDGVSWSEAMTVEALQEPPLKVVEMSSVELPAHL